MGCLNCSPIYENVLFALTEADLQACNLNTLKYLMTFAKRRWTDEDTTYIEFSRAIAENMRIKSALICREVTVY